MVIVMYESYTVEAQPGTVAEIMAATDASAGSYALLCTLDQNGSIAEARWVSADTQIPDGSTLSIGQGGG